MNSYGARNKMNFHYAGDPGEPETCPNRNEILRAFASEAEGLSRILRSHWASAERIAFHLGFRPREVDEVLREAGMPVTALDGERLFPLTAKAERPPFQRVKDFSPSALAERMARRAGHDDPTLSC